jgi:Na+/H+-translocating membrane pyrophosphatase
MDIAEKIKEELQLISESIVGVKWQSITLRKIKRELISNGVSLAIAIFVTSFLSNIFVAKAAKNLWGLGSKKVKVNKDTMNIMETLMIFVIGLLVFTLVEQIMENYYKLKDEKMKE